MDIEKDAHKAMCRNGSEENENRHKDMKNKGKKALQKQ